MLYVDNLFSLDKSIRSLSTTPTQSKLIQILNKVCSIRVVLQLCYHCQSTGIFFCLILQWWFCCHYAIREIISPQIENKNHHIFIWVDYVPCMPAQEFHFLFVKMLRFVECCLGNLCFQNSCNFTALKLLLHTALAVRDLDIRTQACTGDIYAMWQYISRNIHTTGV